jgi:hypothetical protein
MLEENTGFTSGNQNDLHGKKNSAWTRAKAK